jgi:DNA repair exonuclease SbcCD ATPase subunit
MCGRLQKSESHRLRKELAASRHEQESLRHALASTKSDAAHAVKAARRQLDEYAALVQELRAEHEKWAEERSAADAADVDALRTAVASLTEGRCPTLT